MDWIEMSAQHAGRVLRSVGLVLALVRPLATVSVQGPAPSPPFMPLPVPAPQNASPMLESTPS